MKKRTKLNILILNIYKINKLVIKKLFKSTFKKTTQKNIVAFLLLHPKTTTHNNQKTS
jgi:hypothetical protein